VPGGAYSNKTFLGPEIDYDSSVEEAMRLILVDPQTSGGLLFAVSEKEAISLLKRLKDSIPAAEIIGNVTARLKWPIRVE